MTLEVTTRPPRGGPSPSRSAGRVRPTGVLRLEEGDAVVVTGRVRRRFFRAGGATASRTEVVADAVWPAHHRARVTRAVDRALEEVPGRAPDELRPARRPPGPRVARDRAGSAIMRASPVGQPRTKTHP